MKHLFFVLLFFTLNARAENWLNYSKIVAGSIEAYSIKSTCEAVSHEQCFDLGVYPSTVYSEVDVEVDDTDHPVYSKSEIESCSTTEQCDTIHAAKICTDHTENSIKNYDLMQVYCSKFLHYEQKTAKTIGLDSDKLTTYQAAQTVAAALKDKADAIAYARRLMNCGQGVIAYMLVRNQPKALTTVQVDLLVQTYAPIKSLLETGSLVTAKEKILAVVADGVIVTEADKTALAAEIDLCN